MLSKIQAIFFSGYTARQVFHDLMVVFDFFLHMTVYLFMWMLFVVLLDILRVLSFLTQDMVQFLSLVPFPLLIICWGIHDRNRFEYLRAESEKFEEVQRNMRNWEAFNSMKEQRK